MGIDRMVQIKTVFKTTLLLAIVSLSSLSQNGFASMGLDLSLLGGFGYTYNAGTPTNGIAMGARVSYLLNPTWEAGFSYTTYPVNAGYTGSSSIYSFTTLDINYHLSGELHPLAIGAMMGIGNYNVPGGYIIVNNTVITIPNSPVSAFGFGGRVAYDFKLGSGFSAGPEGRFIYTLGNTAASNFQAFGALKYSF
jgi:hypothetical protein